MDARGGPGLADAGSKRFSKPQDSHAIRLVSFDPLESSEAVRLLKKNTDPNHVTSHVAYGQKPLDAGAGPNVPAATT